MKPVVKDFIQKHKVLPLPEVALKLSKNPDLPRQFILQQINGIQKAGKKLPEWSKKEITYPPALSLEQCSSEKTAKLKASFYEGNLFIDLSGGFGVDTYYFSRNFKKGIHVDPDSDLQEIVKSNYRVLNTSNVSFINQKAEDFLENFNDKADLIFVDPSRRSENKKVFRFADCSPDITSIREELLEVSEKVLIKASPLLDIKEGLKELSNVKAIHIIAVDNECKETLFQLEKGDHNTQIITANLKKDGKEKLSYTLKEEEMAKANYEMPMNYLYEPNTALLNAGAFKILCEKFKLAKLHPNTHLYTSDKKIPGFPGKCFSLVKVLPFTKKAVDLEIDKTFKLSVTRRNFPYKVKQVFEKLNRKEGSDVKFFACTLKSEKPVLLWCEATS